MAISEEILRRMLQVIRDASTTIAVATAGHRVSKDELERLIEEGFLDGEPDYDMIEESFLFGQLMQENPGKKDISYEAFKRYLDQESPGLSGQTEDAFDLARRRAGNHITNLGNRFGERVHQSALQADQQYLGAVRGGVSPAKARRQTIQKLKQELYDIAGDWEKDWNRIAITETHMAHQEGFYESTTERFGDDALLAKIPEADACEHCKRLYLGPDGVPVIRTASWWAAQGTSNSGLNKLNWKPVLGAVHPHCRCQLVRVPAGWRINESWDLEPEDSGMDKAELDIWTKAINTVGINPDQFKKIVKSALSGDSVARKQLDKVQELVKAAQDGQGFPIEVGSKKVVNTMGNHSNPARTAGETAVGRIKKDDWPFKKRRTTKRLKPRISKEQLSLDNVVGNREGSKKELVRKEVVSETDLDERQEEIKRRKKEIKQKVVSHLDLYQNSKLSMAN